MKTFLFLSNAQFYNHINAETEDEAREIALKSQEWARTMNHPMTDIRIESVTEMTAEETEKYKAAVAYEKSLAALAEKSAAYHDHPSNPPFCSRGERCPCETDETVQAEREVALQELEESLYP